MERKFILDEEINLLGNNDYLNTKVYVKSLKSTIENAPSGKPFIIGLFGDWGSGKSSIIKTVREDIENERDKKNLFITYDAWKYANDSFRRTFLLEIKEKLKHTESEHLSSFYVNKNDEVKVKKSPNPWIIGFIIILFVIGFIITKIVPSSTVDTDWKLTINSFLALFGLLITVLFKTYDDLKVSIQKPILFAPEQFENCFNEMIEKSLKNYTWIQKTICYVQGENFIKDIDKLIIVIDNIDRCHKEMAYELLTNIKNFLGNKHSIIFIIPVDDSALRRHLNSNQNNVAEEFLRKFFNVTIRIKPYHPEEMYDFSEKLNTKNKLTFSPSTLDIVSKEYAKNPRRIIQFFNNLSVELASYSSDFSKKYESAICKLLIIREEFPDFYNKLVMNPHLLQSLNDEATYPELKGFLNSTMLVTQNIPQGDLEKILSNSTIFSGLSNDILNSINTIDHETLNKFIGENPTYLSTIIKYLMKQFKKGVNRGTFDTEVIPKFNLLASINEMHPIDKIQNEQIHSILHNQDTLNRIFEKGDILLIVKYSNSTHLQSITYLTEYIIRILNGTAGLAGQALTILKNTIQIYKDPSVLKRLRAPFKTNYFKNHEIVDFQSLDSELIEALASDEFLKEIINEIKDLNGEDKYFLDFSQISNSLAISEEIARCFITKISSFYPDFNNKTIQEIQNSIKVWNNSLMLLKNIFNSNTDEIYGLYKKIVEDRTITVSVQVRPGIPQYGTRVENRSQNFVNESINEPSIVEDIVIFLCNIQRLTAGHIIINDTLTKLLQNPTNRNILNKHLLELSKTSSIYSLSDTIMTDNTYTNYTMSLFKLIFIGKNPDESYVIPDDKLNEKLGEILALIYNNSAQASDLNKFIDDIVSDERNRKIIANLIQSTNAENILKLSSKIKILALDNILIGEKIFEYEDDMGFLKLIATNGGNKHISKLVNVLVAKIQKETEFGDAISILMDIKHLNGRDARRIKTELENYQATDTYVELIKKAISHTNSITEK